LGFEVSAATLCWLVPVEVFANQPRGEGTRHLERKPESPESNPFPPLFSRAASNSLRKL